MGIEDTMLTLVNATTLRGKLKNQTKDLFVKKLGFDPRYSFETQEK